MSEIEEKDGVDEKAPPRLARPGRLELRKTVETGQVRQSFSHGRSKTVTVEVRRKRTFAPGEGGRMKEVIKSAPTADDAFQAAPKTAEAAAPAETRDTASRRADVLKTLTVGEKETRARALETALRVDQEARQNAAAEEEQERAKVEAVREAEAQSRPAEEPAPPMVEEPVKPAEVKAKKAPSPKAAPERARGAKAATDEGDTERTRGKRGKGDPRRSTLAPRRDFSRRRSGKLTIGQALIEEDRVRSLASMRRARARERQANQQKAPVEPVKVVREVVVPEVITVQELANRMAVRGADVVKLSTKLDTALTVTQSIDADTAELLVAEFGHKARRVSAADVEIGLKRESDDPASLKSRPPVVTVMGHVDHGKTSLLDALRQTDVVSGEAGGITQHIGAYQVISASGGKITFVDTPGHEAFSAMRARGATVTDIVVLVVAADDGVMPQTIEAINHARAAEVPIIVAINKMDRPSADPDRVRNDLLHHEIVVEEMGGEVLSIEVSATEKLNLDKLEEAILLQAELLDLKANPDRAADGVVIESRLDRGRGPVATVLVQNGTLRVGDIIVAGVEWARVRALLDDHGSNIDEAGPSVPVEILGLGGAPTAGDELVTVENERRAREVTEYRQTQLRDLRAAAGTRGTLEQMFAEINAGQANELPILIKADVQGSVEAIVASLEKLGTDEVSVQILHSGVGGINESDITLAEASKALIIGFNVRANAQARINASARGIDIRYYSVIYNLIDDIKASLSGLLPPILREKITGNAQVLQVFEISKLGKIAGCRVTDGVIHRGAKVRLIRDDSVIHEGKLSTLRRFKDNVREVKDGFECGMSFENYHDIREGDVIESVEVEEIARTL